MADLCAPDKPTVTFTSLPPVYSSYLNHFQEQLPCIFCNFISHALTLLHIHPTQILCGCEDCIQTLAELIPWFVAAESLQMIYKNTSSLAQVF